MSSTDFAPGERSRLERHPERGSHERDDVYAILDEGFVCHVGLALDGRPLVIPMLYGRDGDRLLLHGAVKGRLLQALAGGAEVCIVVTLVDGLVVARSTFHSSLNYRSVVAFGRARRVAGAAERARALELLVEHLIPGRTPEARPSSDGELAATEVVEFLIEEATAKVRSGPPQEPAQDRTLPIWAGVLPLGLAVGAPLPAPDLAPGLPVSDSVAGWRRPPARSRT